MFAKIRRTTGLRKACWKKTSTYLQKVDNRDAGHGETHQLPRELHWKLPSRNV